MISRWMRNKRIRPLDETATTTWMKMGHDTRGRNACRDENQMNEYIQNPNEKLNAEGRPMKKSMAGGGVPLSGVRKAVRCLNIDGVQRSAVVEEGPPWSIAVGAREREGKRRGRPGRSEGYEDKGASDQLPTNKIHRVVHCISSHPGESILFSLPTYQSSCSSLACFELETERFNICASNLFHLQYSLRMCIVLFVRLGCEGFGGLALLIRY